MNDIAIARIRALNWHQLQHARHDQVDLEAELVKLFGSDAEIALSAVLTLGDCLCHEHVQIAEAYPHAFPFLIDALMYWDEWQQSSVAAHDLVFELLALFWGTTRCVIGLDMLRPIEIFGLHWTKLPVNLPLELDPVSDRVKQQLLDHRFVFEAYLTHPDDDIFEQVGWITASFSETPLETANVLATAIGQTKRPERRAALYSAFKSLELEDMPERLMSYFEAEHDLLPRIVLAGQLASLLREACPQPICDLLQQVVFETPFDAVNKFVRSILWTDGFYPDFAFPLAVARPDLHADILDRCMLYAEGGVHRMNPAYLLALAFGFDGMKRPILSQLVGTQQLRAMDIVYQNGKSKLVDYNQYVRRPFDWFCLPNDRKSIKKLLKQRGEEAR